ncbi:MAG: GPW/gp25 family protein [Bacillota bacterium]
MAKEFLGKGWAFPAGVGADGRIRMSEGEQDIREAIWIILSTSKGERVMRPDFGCGIHEFVFAPVNTATIALIGNSVREALTLCRGSFAGRDLGVCIRGGDGGSPGNYAPSSCNHELKPPNLELKRIPAILL